MLRTKKIVLAAVVGVGVLTAASAAAGGPDPDGVNLQAPFISGGKAWLELEDRNSRPAICFIWENPGPQDGDAIASRVLDRAGNEVVDLGVGDQWIDGAAEGCETPVDDRYRRVFADPAAYVVEFRVVENQGTPPTGPVRSASLQRISG